MSYIKKLYAGIGLLLAITLASCQKKELDVAYLYIDEFILPAAASYAPTSEEVEAVRVVLGPTSLGIYPLPARIPILGTGSRPVRLEAVVRRAGVSDNLTVYPYYSAFDESLTLPAPSALFCENPCLTSLM